MDKVSKKKKFVDSTSNAAKPDEKAGILANAMVRIDPKSANYVQMYNESNDSPGGKGWYVAVDHPRVPELHKDIRMLLTAAVRDGCALFATEGGMRVMLSPSGKGGLFFVERKNATKGAEVYLFKTATEENCKKLSLYITRNSKGIYVAPRDTEGNIIYRKLKDNFGNNQSPMNFKAHEWPGMVFKVEEAVKKVAKKVKEKAEKAGATKTADAAEKVIEKVGVSEGKNAPVKVAKTPGKVVKKEATEGKPVRAATA